LNNAFGERNTEFLINICAQDEKLMTNQEKGDGQLSLFRQSHYHFRSTESKDQKNQAICIRN
jgi:hypothetical protein